MVVDLWFCRDNCVSVRTASHDQARLWLFWSVRAAIKGSGVDASCMDSAFGRDHTAESRAGSADMCDGDARSHADERISSKNFCACLSTQQHCYRGNLPRRTTRLTT